jgi:hypothetical protein
LGSYGATQCVRGFKLQRQTATPATGNMTVGAVGGGPAERRVPGGLGSSLRGGLTLHNGGSWTGNDSADWDCADVAAC